MKKTPRKLVLRRETLRALDNMALAHVVGGADSGDVPCAHRNLADTGRVACEATTGAIATTARD